MPVIERVDYDYDYEHEHEHEHEHDKDLFQYKLPRLRLLPPPLLPYVLM